jgi:hypothetical protein
MRTPDRPSARRRSGWWGGSEATLNKGLYGCAATRGSVWDLPIVVDDVALTSDF